MKQLEDESSSVAKPLMADVQENTDAKLQKLDACCRFVLMTVFPTQRLLAKLNSAKRHGGAQNGLGRNWQEKREDTEVHITVDLQIKFV